jgi:hypothetical protein
MSSLLPLQKSAFFPSNRVSMCSSHPFRFYFFLFSLTLPCLLIFLFLFSFPLPLFIFHFFFFFLFSPFFKISPKTHQLTFLTRGGGGRRLLKEKLKKTTVDNQGNFPSFSVTNFNIKQRIIQLLKLV